MTVCRYRRGVASGVVLLALLVACTTAAYAQAELLPVDHPATRALVRAYEYGAIPEFPREHLPISRGLALRLLTEGAGMANLPAALRDQLAYYRAELAADIGETPISVAIPTSDDSWWVLDPPDTFPRVVPPGLSYSDVPFAVVDYRDSARGIHAILEPVLDGELRFDPDAATKTAIFQGGLQLRGTLLNHFGFSGRVTNGTIVGDSALAARDPRYGLSGVLGITGKGRDVDFGGGSLRLDFDAVAAEIGREAVQLGGGLEQSLLLGSTLPTSFDYLRFNARVGKVSFTHIHASLLADAGSGAKTGPDTYIPSKYVAAHLLSFGPFGGIRGSIGESVVYSKRPFEIGYINPINFFKAQEHFLRDRDNANMYVALSANVVDGLFLEGELMIDDLRFSLIGDSHWANKIGWRLGAQSRAVLFGALDFGLSYTHLEPYIYTHFNDTNAYTHNNSPLAAGGLMPNSRYFEGVVTAVPIPKLWVRGTIGLGEHGANVMAGDTIARNVGGDIRFTRSDRRGDSYFVTFLDGDLEKIVRLRLEVEYEPLRNLYIRATAFRNEIGSRSDMQVWLGVRVGAH